VALKCGPKIPIKPSVSAKHLRNIRWRRNPLQQQGSTSQWAKSSEPQKFLECLVDGFVYLSAEIACYVSRFQPKVTHMSGKTPTFRLGRTPGSSASILGKNVQDMKSLMALALMFWASSARSYTVSGTIYTTNGSQSDVQAACNAAPDNGTVTVIIPNGTYTWTGTLSITHSLTLAGQSAGGVIIRNNLVNGDMIDATASANGNINIYWLDIQQIVYNNGTGYAIGADRAQPTNYTVLIHDCVLDTQTFFGYAVAAEDNGIIFWNDTFPATGAGPNSVTGINFEISKYGYTSSWNTPDSYGTEDTTGLANSYVENCSFSSGPNSGCNFGDNSRVVWRYNTMQDSQVGMHGQDSVGYGARHWEIYHNTFIQSPGNPQNNLVWIGARGGAGVIWGNAMDDIGAGRPGINFSVFNITFSYSTVPCQTAYPAARQTGQGWSASSTATYGNPVVTADGIGDVTAGVWIWNNTGAGPQDSDFIQLNQPASSDDACGNNEQVSNFVQEGRDYFLSAKPGYTPYTYPHPLHTQYALPTPAPTPNATPLAPQNLRVVN
jgi:hypothetical protein